MRLFAALLVATLAVPPAPVASATQVPRSGVEHALSVLHAWDQQRAQAWGASDEAAVESLYVRGSSAAVADVRLLRSYTSRGFVVRRLVTQVFGLRVLRSAPDRLVVRVLDRVAGGEVTTPDGSVRLPSTRPVVRRIVLVHLTGHWRVASVTGSG